MDETALLAGPARERPPEHINLQQVRRTIRESRKASIEYTDGKGHGSKRVIWPIGLAFFERSSVVIAWCELREGFRAFRVDPILSWARLAEGLPRPRLVLLRESREQEGIPPSRSMGEATAASSTRASYTVRLLLQTAPAGFGYGDEVTREDLVRVLIQHRSLYRYPTPAALGPQLDPAAPGASTRAPRIESYQLAIEPAAPPALAADPHGNHVARVTFKAGTRVADLDVPVELAVDIRPVNPFDFFVDDRAKTLPFAYPDELRPSSRPFLDASDPAFARRRALEALPRRAAARRADTVPLLVELNRRVTERVRVRHPRRGRRVDARGDARRTAAAAAATRRCCSSRLLRARGLAARFVSAATWSSSPTRA